MNKTKNKCEIVIEVVTWSNGKPTKWRAKGVVTNSKGTKVTQIFGDPHSTEDGAWRSLWDECNRFDNAASMIHGELIKGKHV